MWGLGTTLVVDGSEVYRRLLCMLLKPFSEKVLDAATPSAAIGLIDAHDDIKLVICDVVMEGGDGFQVLKHVRARPEPRPRVVMVTAYHDAQATERALRLGASAYLPKPTTIRQLFEALRRDSRRERRSHERFRCTGRAHLLEGGGEDSLVFDLYDISLAGAFLETAGPLQVGAELDLRLEIGGHEGEVRAGVVRVQEPSWIDVPGVGVEFASLSDAAESAIRAAIDDADRLG